MVSHTCFSHVENASAHNNVQLCVEGQLDAVLLEAKMVRQLTSPPASPFAKHPAFINGVEDWRAEIRTGHSDMLKILDDGQASGLYSAQGDGEYKERSYFWGFCRYPLRGVDAGQYGCKTTEYKSTDSPLPLC
jgi:hypothetical protein